jgi:hypothetical protein
VGVGGWLGWGEEVIEEATEAGWSWGGHGGCVGRWEMGMGRLELEAVEAGLELKL